MAWYYLKKFIFVSSLIHFISMKLILISFII